MSESTSHSDIRMRGFLNRKSVKEAQDWCDAQSTPLPSDVIPLRDAHRRVLAADVVSPIDVPPFDRSAMDGFALIAEDTFGASDYNNLRFTVVGSSFPGDGFSRTVENGQAIRIMTGAPIPDGANAVIPVEYSNVEQQGKTEQLLICESTSPGKHIGRQGEDILAGQVILEKGRSLRPQDLGVMASVGLNEITVHRKPNVTLLVTGNELVSPGTPLEKHQIYDANSFVLRSLVARDGGELVSQIYVPDDEQKLKSLLQSVDTDVVLLSGGSSVGQEDHGPQLVAKLGELPFHGISMRPSSPAGMGKIGNTLVFLLPGNPVSCLCAYDFFAGRAIRQLGSRHPEWPYQRQSFELNSKIASVVGRLDYCRIRIVDGNATPISVGGASILSSTTRANGFTIIPEDSEGLPAGETVDVFLYDEPGQYISPDGTL